MQNCVMQQADRISKK